MGTLVGHVAPGFAFLALGLWHLFNHIRLHCLHPKTYRSWPWFPVAKVRYAELFLIMLGSSISISMELFIGPEKHQPFDPDGTIPSNHLHNFEHSSISMTFFTYAVFAIILDKTNPVVKCGLTNLIGAIAFAQQLFLFHLHSADHAGVEGQYHLLLQFIIALSLATTIMSTGMGMRKSFLLSFVRSVSITFQGIWLIIMGFILWTPHFVPKGCFVHLEKSHHVVRCSSHEALDRAKSLVNIHFSWTIIAITIFVISFYLVLQKIYDREQVEYSKLIIQEQGKAAEDESEDDVESQARRKQPEESKSFIQMGKALTSIDIER